MTRPLTISARRAKATAGFTLVEMLVALVIVSIGLLGMTRLALESTRSNNSALMRSQATALVQQIIENMRSNQPQATAGTYNIGIGSIPAPALPANPVAYDLYEWKARMQADLPDGDGSITTAVEVNPLTGGQETVATVSVQWDDSVAESTFGEALGVKTLTVETML